MGRFYTLDHVLTLQCLHDRRPGLPTRSDAPIRMMDLLLGQVTRASPCIRIFKGPGDAVLVLGARKRVLRPEKTQRRHSLAFTGDAYSIGYHKPYMLQRL